MEPQAFEKMRKKIYNKDKNIAGLYDLEDTIGSGHFAQVKLAKHVFTGAKVAVKVIDKTKLDDEAKSHLHKEVSCMKLVQHPNIVRMYQVIDTQSKLYLILEYGDGGDLYDHIMNNGKGVGMSEEKARHYFKQIVSAIDYCHKLHVVHRDLKPENVILFRQGNNDLVKLTDFGFSNVFVPEKTLDTSCGSLAYSAPEILLGGSYDPTSVDVWSLGVILYMMVCGHGPFNHANDSETMTNIIDCKYDMPDELSNECKNLIKQMLVSAPAERASLKMILQNKWVRHDHQVEIPLDPLISQMTVSVDVHLSILQDMSSEWSREQIENSLRSDDYGNITATYYLLAESKLKEERRRRYANQANHAKITKRHSLPPKKQASPVENERQTQKIPYAKEVSVPTTDLTNELSHSDERLNESSNNSEDNNEFVARPIASRSNRMSYPFPSRSKSKSSPNLPSITEPITEEESEFEDSPRNSPHVGKKMAARRTTISSTCRLSPILSRRSSYSSSDDDDSHLLLLSRPNSTHAHMTGNTNTTTTKETSKSKGSTEPSLNTKYKATSTDNLNAKMLSLLLDDLGHLTPKATSNVALNNLVNNAYGRHLSDTNLTTYSMHLQLALAAEKLKTYSTTHHQSKSNSDTNLVKKFYKKKHNSFSADIFKTKEMIFRYLKRTKGGNKAVSPISLSATIQEEDPVISTTPPHRDDSSFSDTFSDIHEHCSESENEVFSSSPQKSESRSSVKYYPQTANEVVSGWTTEIPNDTKTESGIDEGVTTAAKTMQTTETKQADRPKLSSIPVVKAYSNVVVAEGSVCCSLV